MARENKFLRSGEGGGEDVEEGDLENCAYFWRNAGYAPGYTVLDCEIFI